MTFAELKLTKQFTQAAEDAGFEHPTDIQTQAIPPIRAGQDVVGIAPTGTGKTAAFLLPLLSVLKYAQGEVPRGLVLAPTKELVIQITGEAHKFAQYTDLRIIGLYGGIGPKQQLAEIAAGVDLLIATPGRFLDLYSRGGIFPRKIKHVVIDEADRMMDMGFMPQLRNIQELLPSKRQNLLFSATFPERVERLADEFLLWPTRVEVAPQATPSRNVTQYQVDLANFRTKLAFLEHLLRTEKVPDSRWMVFVRRKEDAESIAKYLDRVFDFGVRAIHSNKAQNSRLNAMETFRKGEIRVLISTDVSARGIDVPETDCVINFSVPGDPHDYVHRIGRTGRAHHKGKSITFIDDCEGYAMKRVVELTGMIPEKLEVPEEVERFETPRWEKQIQAKVIDKEMRKIDPEYKGAFHEKKRKPAAKRKPRRR